MPISGLKHTLIHLVEGLSKVFREHLEQMRALICLTAPATVLETSGHQLSLPDTAFYVLLFHYCFIAGYCLVQFSLSTLLMGVYSLWQANK